MEKLLSFSAALNEMLVHGAKIQRAAWPERDYMYIKDGHIFTTDDPANPVGLITCENVLAQDWRIVGEKLQSTFIPA